LIPTGLADQIDRADRSFDTRARAIRAGIAFDLDMTALHVNRHCLRVGEVRLRTADTR
jgi:hypothetical protein